MSAQSPRWPPGLCVTTVRSAVRYVLVLGGWQVLKHHPSSVFLGTWWRREAAFYKVERILTEESEELTFLSKLILYLDNINFLPVWLVHIPLVFCYSIMNLFYQSRKMFICFYPSIKKKMAISGWRDGSVGKRSTGCSCRERKSDYQYPQNSSQVS